MLVEEMMDQNCWANLKLLEFCKALTPEQLETDASGTFGKLIDTLRHIVRADVRYLIRLGHPVTEDMSLEGEWSIDELIDFVHKCREGWKAYFASGEEGDMDAQFAGDRWFMRREVPITQALHHGTHHRAEATVNLSLLGLEPPGLSAWDWGLETGRMKNLGPVDPAVT